MVAALLPERRGGGKSAIGGTGRRAVQVELQLEQVKVVRNDLTDTDVELVQVRPRKEPAKAPSAAAESAIGMPTVEVKRA
jgi:hypothetical protein